MKGLEAFMLFITYMALGQESKAKEQKEIIEKELKALEIIKEKLCDFEFYDCEDEDDGENNGHYYLIKIKGKGYITRYGIKLKKEEYDLLKEVLNG